MQLKTTCCPNSIDKLSMSMEAQFYEARRRQSWIERRRSFQVENDVHRLFKLNIPVRIVQQDFKVRELRSKLARSDQSLFQRDRDIYPRPVPLANTNLRRTKRTGKLARRFSSTDYLQQW